MLTGNYNFFNLLTMLLCLFLFDELRCAASYPRAVLPRSHARRHGPGAPRPALATLWR